MTADTLWIIVIGAATNAACAIVGCYLVLRRMSMMGDAISHAVLPGLVLAFLFSNSLNIVPLFVGAVLVGILTTFLTQTLHQYGRVNTDASMGVVFTSLFALGVVLIKRYANDVHFDVSCVYEGSLLMAVFDTQSIGGIEVPRQAITVIPILLLNALVVTVFWKELKLSSFDAPLADSMGFSATFLHYLLMVLVALTTVASFKAVGSILVIAMLIVPGATAHLLTDRLNRMLWIAVGIGVLSSVFGYWLSTLWDVEPSGMMTIVAGFCYAMAVLWSPQYGVVSKLVNNLRTSLRVIREDILAMLYRTEELDSTKFLNREEALEGIGESWLAKWGLNELIKNGSIVETESRLQLTTAGRSNASKLIRSHRLWEAYLVQHLGLAADHVHAPAERMEHYIDGDMQIAIEKELDASDRDPHGRNIPPTE